MNSLEKLFAEKTTENGDKSYITVGDNLLDILFMTEYFSNHLDEVRIGKTYKEKLFSMFIRDPRYGLGRKDLGVKLEERSDVPFDLIAKAGRFDDFFRFDKITVEAIRWLWEQVKSGNELAKKWMPRFNTRKDAIAKEICSILHISQKEYRKTIKTDTVENKLSHQRINEINYEQVPSLAMIKYYQRFMKEEAFQSYIRKVKDGEAKLKVSTTTVYDIYKNRDKIDADLFFDNLEKISINCIPILDTSGSMEDINDSLGKAMSIAYYLAKCSTYCNNHVVSFSSRPQLIKIQDKPGPRFATGIYSKNSSKSKFIREINSMYTGDCSNTDFGAVIELLSRLEEYPDYFVVLSDMEFDMGSSMSKDRVMKLFEERGIKTKIIWWNFNSRNKTVPEIDEKGNVYISGYNPMLLKYLEAGFDGKKFLNKLLEEYLKNLQ